MPKYKLRKSGEDGRIHKGKCASVINFDISEQCFDEQKISMNCDVDNVYYQAKTDEESTIHCPRTFDEIMLSAMDECNSKWYQIRSDALTTVYTQLQQTHNPNFLKNHNERLLTIIQNALDSNIPCEIDAASSVISIAAIQMPDSDRSFQAFYKPLRAILNNYEYLKSSTRFAVYRAIGILTFLYETDGYRIAKVMNEFKEIFACKASFDKVTKINYESQLAALETWTFLMTLLSSGSECCDIKSIFSQYSAENFITLLESHCFGLRVTCAKAIAVIFECGVEKDKDCLELNLTKIIERLSAIIRVYNARRTEIKSPLEVRHYLETGITPHVEVKIGNSTLIVNNWALNVQYEMVCNITGSVNVTKHLAKNKKLFTKLTVMGQSTKTSSYSPRLKDANGSNILNVPTRIIATPVQQKEYDFDKITNYLQLASHKSPRERTKALEQICKEVHQVPQNFLTGQKNVILDIIVKAMKRGDDTEQLTAIRLVTLTIFQLDRTERFCSEVSNIFLNSLKHSSSSMSTNASICLALALIELADNEEGNKIFLEPAMNLFRQIFSGTQSNHKTLKEPNDPNERLLRTKALEAWGLVVTLCSPKDVCSMVKSRHIKELTDLLVEHSTIEFRVACAQVISLIIERGRISERNYLKSEIPNICYAVKDIINDRKNASGDKRLLLNTNLREVLKYLEDGTHLLFRLRFSNEVHELKTWSSIFIHHKLSQFIDQNFSTYLVENERLRCLKAIGPKPVVRYFDYPPNTQYKLSSAAKKISKTKENRLHSRMPKYDCP